MSSNSASSAQIFQLLAERKGPELKLLLSSNPVLNFFHISDSKGYTVLHHSALTNQLEVLERLLSYMRKSPGFKPNLFTAWVNRESLDEGFTALHLACYKGNIEAAQTLLANGADIEKQTFQGFTSLHIAAQADQISALVLLKSSGCDLNALDCKGSSALHWAAYTGCEQAINYLTRWSSMLKMNLKDLDQGYTPLHLATITGNSKIVRRLLIKGADPTILDNSGKKPVDLARESHFKNIGRMLQTPWKILECYRITPIFHYRKSKVSFITFWVIFFGVNAANLLIDFPSLLSTPWTIIQLSLSAFTFVFFLISWLRTPGFIPQGEESQLLSLTLEHLPGDVCSDCGIVKKQRAKHCDSCGRCVEIFDHHCPWIANCVGVRNHRFFFVFLISLWLLMVFSLIKCGFFLISPQETGIFWVEISEIDLEAASHIKIVVQGLVILILFIFLIPTSVLLFVQMGNFLLNKTTSERFGYNVKRERRSFEDIEEKLEERQESIETTAPSMTSTRGLLGKRKKSRSLKRYLTNCLDMCYRNERKAFLDA